MKGRPTCETPAVPSDSDSLLIRGAGQSPGGEASKALGVLVFASGKEAEPVAVGQGAERFRAIAVVAQAVVGEDARFEDGGRSASRSNAARATPKPAVQVAQGLKQLRF